MSQTPPIKLTDRNHQDAPDDGFAAAHEPPPLSAAAARADGVDVDNDELTRDLATIHDRAPALYPEVIAAVSRMAGAIETASTNLARTGRPSPTPMPTLKPTQVKLVLFTRADEFSGPWNAKAGAIKSGEVRRPWLLNPSSIIGVRPALSLNERRGDLLDSELLAESIGDGDEARVPVVGTIITLGHGLDGAEEVTVAEPMRTVINQLRDLGFDIAPTDTAYDCTVANIQRVPKPEPKPKRHTPAKSRGRSGARSKPAQRGKPVKPSKTSKPSKPAKAPSADAPDEEKPPRSATMLPPMF